MNQVLFHTSPFRVQRYFRITARLESPSHTCKSIHNEHVFLRFGETRIAEPGSFLSHHSTRSLSGLRLSIFLCVRFAAGMGPSIAPELVPIWFQQKLDFKKQSRLGERKRCETIRTQCSWGYQWNYAKCERRNYVPLLFQKWTEKCFLV